MKPTTSIGSYLIQRLHAHGVRHVFGLPGDYVLGFYDLLQRGPLRVVNTCDEQGAGFAADAYARMRGLGAVCVTYCVGGLKVANPIAGAFAEKSPVVVITGQDQPGNAERVRALGALDYLLKPLNESQLLAAIGKVTQTI